jgi:hypothetical protein
MDVNGMPVYSPPRSGYLNRKPEVLAYFQTNPTGIFFCREKWILTDPDVSGHGECRQGSNGLHNLL